MEDYLEAIGDLERSGKAARVRDIARLTDVSMSTVTASLKQLGRAGLVNYDPYEWVSLTDSGRELSGQIRRRHDELASFLQEVLHVDDVTCQANACRMEHVVDDSVLSRLTLLGAFLRSRGPRGRQLLEEFRRFCQSRTGGKAPQEAME
jgi:DtxR family transcriptional regulator, Mn-dependent transcriptional regulator